MKRIFYIGIFLIVTVSSVISQNYADILNVRYILHQNNEISEKNITDIAVSEFNTEVVLPIEFENKNILIPGFIFYYYSMSNNVDTLLDTRLYSFEIPLSFVYNWKNPKLKSYIGISGKLNSDLKNIKSNHFQFSAITLFMYDWKKDFTVKLGVFYNSETYGPYITPLVGLDWKTGERSYLSFLIPSYARFEYRLSEKLYFGPEIEIFSASYRLGNTIFPDSYINLFGENNMAAVKKVRIFIDFYTTDHLVLFAKGGYRISLMYEQYGSDEKKIIVPERIEGQLKNCFFAEFGLAYRFRFED